MAKSYSIKVNGEQHQVEAAADTPLLWVLRDHLKLNGTKYSCGIGECGSCMVLVDGEAVPSCQLPIADVGDRDVTTIEGLSGPIADRLKRAWVAEQVPQCGYCQCGQIVTAAALLGETPRPTDTDIDAAMGAVLCRCGSYNDIRRAIHRAAKEK